MARRGRPRCPDVLTPREWEVLGLLREGFSNEAIAARLGISVDGVKYHVSGILSKLGVSSRKEAALWTPGRRPAPALIGSLFRHLHDSLAARAAASAVVLASAVGLALFIWAVLNEDDESGTFSLWPGFYVLDTHTGQVTRLLDTKTEPDYSLGLPYATMAWSPNGAYLAVTSRQPERWASKVVTRDGGEAVPLYGASGVPAWTSEGLAVGRTIFDAGTGGQRSHVLVDDSASELVWSPDGSRIAFTRSSIDQPSGVFLLDLKAGQERQLISGLYHFPQWSPTGRLLAAWGSHPSDVDGIALLVFDLLVGGDPVVIMGGAPGPVAWAPDESEVVVSGGRTLHVATLSSSDAGKRLTEGEAPTWSPDGRTLAFTRNGELWQIDMATREEKKLVSSPLPVIGEAHWSPDGRYVAFRTAGDQRGIYTIEVNGDNERYLAPGDQPLWSPSGDDIAFIFGKGGLGFAGHLYVMEPDASNIRQLGPVSMSDVAPVTCGYDIWLNWSPDGKRLVYSTFAFVSGQRPSSLVADLSGATQPLGVAGFPAWLPDGRLVVTVRDPAAEVGCSVDAIDPTTQQRTRLADSALYAALSPSGQLLAVTSGSYRQVEQEFFGTVQRRMEVYRRTTVAHVSSNAEPIDLGEGWLPLWSPDGRHLALQGAEGLMMYSIADGEMRTIAPRAGQPAWSPDGRMLAYAVQIEPFQSVIYVLTVDSRAPARLLTEGWHPSWAPDGKRLVFSR
jgi:Tol biopolymer transport system component/DNA-binding CsgD family transcriptional regulator